MLAKIAKEWFHGDRGHMFLVSSAVFSETWLFKNDGILMFLGVSSYEQISGLFYKWNHHGYSSLLSKTHDTTNCDWPNFIKTVKKINAVSLFILSIKKQ